MCAGREVALAISNKDIFIYSRVSNYKVSTAFPIFLFYSNPDILNKCYL